MNILFNRISGLGDILMTTAVVDEVRKQNPDAYISYRTNHPEVLEGNKDINEIIKANEGLTGSEIFNKSYDEIIDLDFCVCSQLVDQRGKI